MNDDHKPTRKEISQLIGAATNAAKIASNRGQLEPGGLFDVWVSLRAIARYLAEDDPA